MIAAIEGQKFDIQGNLLFIKTQSGVVYETIATANLIEAALETTDLLQIPTQVIYREDSQTIYAFEDFREKVAFNILIKVPGISGQSAMIILDSIEAVSELYEAIADNDTAYLVKIKGIGLNKAKAIIEALKTKVSKLIEQPAKQ